jgi:hypothetical protein
VARASGGDRDRLLVESRVLDSRVVVLDYEPHADGREP